MGRYSLSAFFPGMDRELLQLLSADLSVSERESVVSLLKYFRGQSFLLHYFERLFLGRSIGSDLMRVRASICWVVV